MDDCLFCGIVAGTVPSVEVHSTEQTYAFRDINPAARVHVLVVPRRHIVDAAAITEADAADVAALFTSAQAVAEREGIADSGYRLVFNVGEDALNSVGHLHLHVLGGERMAWGHG